MLDQFAEHVFDGSLRRELKQLIRQKATVTLLELRTAAIRWEREGMPGGSRGRSHSVPSIHSVQYAVHGGLRPATGSPMERSELSEIKEMMRQQQEQLNQLSQTVAMLQRPPLRPRNAIICRRCQQPGHIAQDCDGPRVTARTQAPQAVHSRAHGSSSHLLPGN